MYRRRPRRRLWKRAEPAPAPRQRRDRIPPSEARRPNSRAAASLAPEGRPLISRGRQPPGKRLGWKFSARKRGMYRRRPRRRLGKRAEPAPAPRQRRDRIPPSEARRRRRLPKGLPGIVSHLGTVERLGVCVKGRFRALTLGRTNAMASFSCRLSLDYSRCTCFVDNILLVCE